MAMSVMISSSVAEFLFATEQIWFRAPLDSKTSCVLTLLKSPDIRKQTYDSCLD